MDPITLIIIVLLALVAVGVAFAVVRTKQRSGSVLAAPEATSKDGKS